MGEQKHPRGLYVLFFTEMWEQFGFYSMLAVYLDSLERLRAYDCRLLLPGHGSASARPQQTINDCIAHRVKREEQLLAALSSGPRSVADLALQLYKGLPAQMMRFAELQVLAGLRKLHDEGRVQKVELDNAEVWCKC